MKPLDLSLYLVTDSALCHPRSVEAVVELAVEGGATVIQIRDKTRDFDRLKAQVERLKPLVRQRGIPLLLNDHVDLARILEVDGVHVGQGDASAEEARARLGERAIVGLSVTGRNDLATVDSRVVDYVGLGPVFDTATKSDIGSPIGLEEFRAIRNELDLPVVAIGGIDLNRATLVAEAGADGIAVVSAICASPGPERAARELLAAFREGRGRRP